MGAILEPKQLLFLCGELKTLILRNAVSVILVLKDESKNHRKWGHKDHPMQYFGAHSACCMFIATNLKLPFHVLKIFSSHTFSLLFLFPWTRLHDRGDPAAAGVQQWFLPPASEERERERTQQETFKIKSLFKRIWLITQPC